MTQKLKPTQRSLQTLDAALAHLGEDGLPDYPPAKPWPELPHEAPAGPLWVFGYGSLIWNPGFPFTESQVGVLHGHHRALCVWSWEYRGTVQQPGLVLGLDHGGSCRGLAFRVDGDQRAAAIAYLLRREMTTDTYRPVHRAVRLQNGQHVQALTFVVDRRDDRYAGRPNFEAVVDVVANAHGGRGSNLEYVTNTVRDLEQLNIECRDLKRVVTSSERRSIATDRTA